MSTLDLLFPALGDHLPTDHAYPLYGSLAGVVPAVHDPTANLRFAPIPGTPDGPGRLRLAAFSRLRLRLPDDRLRDALPLAGKLLDVAGHRVRLGVPSVLPLTPATTLVSRLVVIKESDRTPRVGPRPVELDPFLTSARRLLATLGVTGELTVPAVRSGPRAGEPRRRVVRIKGRAIVGYEVLVTGLSAADSLTLQEAGLGGRTRIGCGFFLPAKEGV